MPGSAFAISSDDSKAARRPRPATAPLSPIARLARAYFAALMLLTLSIGLEPLLLPADRRAALLSAAAGEEYASVQLPAFAAHPRLMAWHGALGLVFTAVAPFQLWGGLRRRHRTVHRILGVVFVATILAAAVTGVVVAQAVRFSGAAEPVANVFVTVLILICTACGVRSAWRGDRAAHGRWMLRAVGLGIGIGLARLYLFGLVTFAGLSSREALAQALWLGCTTNALLTEAWINRSRRG